MMGGQYPETGMAGAGLHCLGNNHNAPAVPVPSNPGAFRELLESRGVSLVLETLTGQIAKGHTPESDREQNVGVIPDRMRRDHQMLCEFVTPGAQYDLRRALRYAAKLGAMAIAVANRIEHEISQSPQSVGTAVPDPARPPFPGGPQTGARGGGERHLPAASTGDLFDRDAAA